jgi:hypothetical protein
MDFPLQVGNTWSFAHEDVFYAGSKAIRDTLMPNGFTYTQIQGDLFNGFYRKTATKVFNYNLSLNKESVIYDFSKKIGDTVTIDTIATDSIFTTVYAEGSHMSFGQQRHYMAFLSKHKYSSSIGDIYYITDSIGFSYYSGETLHFYTPGGPWFELVYAFINGIGHWLNEGVLEVSNTKNALPDQYQIFQNYPNPFNPETTISFTLSKPDYVSILIFDQLGRNVTTLLSKYMRIGSHSIKWNTQGMPSGVYYYRARIGNSIVTKSMILLK